MTGYTDMANAVFLDQACLQHFHGGVEVTDRIVDAATDAQHLFNATARRIGGQQLVQLVGVAKRARRQMRDRLHAVIMQPLAHGDGIGRIGAGKEGHIDRRALIQKHGIRHIGVAGHPEGSPDISDDEIAEALGAKNELARAEGLDLYIETQFCFEADIVLDWERRVRAAGNALPIRIGIPGPATIKTLFRFAQISGIGPSMRFVAKQAKNVAKLMTVQSPHLLIAGLAEGMAADEDCLIRHFHFYPFGGFARTATYAGAIADGKIEMLPKGGFNVTEG